MDYSIEVLLETYASDQPNWPIARAFVTVESGPLAGVRLVCEVYRFNGRLMVVTPSQPNYVLSDQLHGEICAAYDAKALSAVD